MKALLIYEDFNRATKAIATLRRAAHHADASLEWDIRPWRVDMLKVAPIAAEALMEAADADLIVLADRRAQSLLPDWLEQWATHRHIEDAALAVIGDGNDDVFSAPEASELSRFAARHGLSFIIESEAAPKTQTASALRALPACRLLFYLGTLCMMATPSWKAQAQATPAATNGTSKPDLSLKSAPKSIWENGLGEGFRSTTESIGLSAGATYGIATFGSREAHDLALVSLSYGHMLGRTWGEGHWYRGNLEFRLELFTGAQFSPSSEWLVGLTPQLRYNFATGTRWIPFVDLGAGVTATSIGPPDLSGTFEFNDHAGMGTHWFLKDNVALTVEARYVHWSCAGLSEPNLGLNGVTGMLGLTFFF